MEEAGHEGEEEPTDVFRLQEQNFSLAADVQRVGAQGG